MKLRLNPSVKRKDLLLNHFLLQPLALPDEQLLMNSSLVAIAHLFWEESLTESIFLLTSYTLEQSEITDPEEEVLDPQRK